MWRNNEGTTVSTLVMGQYVLTAEKADRWSWEVRDVGTDTVLGSGARRSLASAREAASTTLAGHLLAVIG